MAVAVLSVLGARTAVRRFDGHPGRTWAARGGPDRRSIEVDRPRHRGRRGDEKSLAWTPIGRSVLVRGGRQRWVVGRSRCWRSFTLLGSDREAWMRDPGEGAGPLKPVASRGSRRALMAAGRRPSWELARSSCAEGSRRSQRRGLWKRIVIDGRPPTRAKPSSWVRRRTAESRAGEMGCMRGEVVALLDRRSKTGLRTAQPPAGHVVVRGARSGLVPGAAHSELQARRRFSGAQRAAGSR